MLTILMLLGIWTTTCTQTQINGRSGYTKESYTIAKDGSFSFSREWFKDSACTQAEEVDVIDGTLTIGPRVSGTMFGQEATQVDFIVEGKTDLGAMSVTDGALKVARGQSGSSIRNTMLGFIKFYKQR